MSVFDDRVFLTPFGYATCGERVDMPDVSLWICFPHETGICFWFLNQEIRAFPDWSIGRYKPLPFKLSPERIAALEPLGQLHSYWRDNIKPGPAGVR